MQDTLKRRLRGLITRECVSKGIHLININFGCEYAEDLLDNGKRISSCARSGIAVAEGQQRRANHRQRGAMSYVA